MSETSSMTTDGESDGESVMSASSCSTDCCSSSECSCSEYSILSDDDFEGQENDVVKTIPLSSTLPRILRRRLESDQRRAHGGAEDCTRRRGIDARGGYFKTLAAAKSRHCAAGNVFVHLENEGATQCHGLPPV